MGDGDGRGLVESGGFAFDAHDCCRGGYVLRGVGCVVDWVVGSKERQVRSKLLRVRKALCARRVRMT